MLINVVAWQTSHTCTTCPCLCFPQFNLLCFCFIRTYKATNYILIQAHTPPQLPFLWPTEIEKFFHLILHHQDSFSGTDFVRAVAWCHMLNLEMSCPSLCWKCNKYWRESWVESSWEPLFWILVFCSDGPTLITFVVHGKNHKTDPHSGILHIQQHFKMIRAICKTFKTFYLSLYQVMWWDRKYFIRQHSSFQNNLMFIIHDFVTWKK